MSRLYKSYKEKFAAELQKELGIKNRMNVPKLKKVVINITTSEATKNIKVLDAAVSDLEQITGQKPVITRAKKAIAGFKLREGMALGTCVTLRGERMYTFVDRLINSAFPRMRDFRGVSGKKFDGRGNYNIGITEQIIFPEIKYEKVDKIRGMNISICTSAENDDHGRALLKKFNMPFSK